MSAQGTLAHALLDSASRRGNAIFCRFEGRTTTWATLAARASSLAAELRARGLGRHDRVAIAMESGPGFLIAYTGTLLAGAAAVPVNPRAPASELEHVLSNSRAKLVLADVPRAEAVSALVSYHRVLTLDEQGDALEAAEAPASLPAPGDDALVLYTSGTTGKSKGAVLTHANLLSNARAVTDAWGWSERDELLLALPLFHMHGLGVGVNGTLVTGGTLDLHARFEARTLLDRLGERRATLFFGVPTMFHRLLEELGRKPAPPHSVRLFVSGSAPLRAETLLAFESVFGARILERYGMSETGMLLGNPLRGERKPGSVGLPFRGVSLRIADGAGSDVPQGETGELLVKGENVFRAYAGDEAATRAAFTEDGWFKTGDLGFRDADGYVFLTGRAKELVITGGFNVAPREVEELLESHPAVKEAAVVGLPDADLGERVAAAVVARAPVTPEELLEWLTPRLAGYKRPRVIRLVDALPRNALGKLQRAAVRTLLSGSS